MKKRFFLAIVFLGIIWASTAQTYWFDDNSSQQRSLGDGGLTEGSDAPAAPAVPIGEGTLILAALAGGYALWKKGF